MQFRARIICAIPALVGLLCCTGCSVTGSHAPVESHDPVKSSAASKVEDASNVPLAPSPSTLTEAYASYMNGVLDEIRGDTQESEKEYSKALSLDPSNPDLVLEAVDRLLNEKKYDLAREILLRATSDKKAPGVLYSKLGIVYAQLGRDADAELACNTAIKKNPSIFEAHRTLYLMQAQKGRPSAALEILERAGNCNCFDVDANLELAESYIALASQAPSLESRIKTNALEVLRRVSSVKNSDPRFSMRLGDDFIHLGAMDEAGKVYLSLISELDDNLPLRLQAREHLVRIFFSQNDQTNAMTQLKEIVREDPSNYPSYYLLGKIADEQHKVDEALSYYSTAAALGGANNPEYFYDMARLQIDAGKPDEAISTLQLIKKQYSWGFTGEILSAIACERKQDFTNAVNHFNAAEVIAKATDRTKLNASFYFDEGSAYERAGIIDQAEIFLLKSLDMNPDDAETLNYLGYMWADKGMKLDKAYDAIQKALKLEPKNAAYLDSMGWVLFKMGKAQEGLDYIQQANALSAEPDATLMEHLGDMFVALKKFGDARDAYKKSLELAPNKDIQKKLDELKPAL